MTINSVFVDKSIKSHEPSLSKSTKIKLKTGFHKICYQNFMKRHPNLKDVQAKIDNVSTKKVIELLAQLDDLQNYPKIFSDPNLQYIAVAAFKKKYITKHECSTLIHFHSVFERYVKLGITPQVVSLFEGNTHKVSPSTESILRDGRELSYKGVSDFAEPKLVKQHWSAFVEKAKKLKKFESVFLTVSDSSKIDKNTRYTIIERLVYGINFNEFFRFQTGVNSSSRIITSIGFTQILCDVYAGKDAVRIDPVIGECDDSDIRWDGLHDTRKFGLQFEGARQPKTADSWESEGDDFGEHDKFHAIRASLIPHQDRKRFIRLADQTGKMERINEKLRVAISARIYDLDFYIYYEDKAFKEYSKEFMFYFSYFDCISSDVYKQNLKDKEILELRPCITEILLKKFKKLDPAKRLFLFRSVVKETMRRYELFTSMYKNLDILFPSGHYQREAMKSKFEVGSAKGLYSSVLQIDIVKKLTLNRTVFLLRKHKEKLPKLIQEFRAKTI